MTRRFLDTLRNTANVLLADNTNRDISPSDVRNIIIDTIDSTVQDEGEIFSTSPTAGVVLTGTFSSLTAIYAAGGSDGGGFINTDFAAGTIVGSSTAGFSYTVRAYVTVNTSNNEEVEFAIGIDGVEDPFFATLTGNGTRNQSVSVGAFDRSASSGAVYTLMARAVDGSATITVDSVRLVVVIQPTNNP